MYISLADLSAGILEIMGAVVLVFFIIALIKFIKLLNSLNDFISTNKENVSKLCEALPVISENTVQLTDNLKDVSEVVTETTADVIVAKDNLVGNFETIKDILNIILTVFAKK